MLGVMRGFFLRMDQRMKSMRYSPEGEPFMLRHVARFAVTTAMLAAGLASAQAMPVADSRNQPLPVTLDAFEIMSVSTLGQVIHEAEFAGFDPRSCINDASHTDPTFGATQWTMQAGFAQQEVAAATYILPASAFPIKIGVMRCLFLTLNAIEVTTTEWSILVWEGTPNNGTLVASYSSDNVILPHLVMPPGTNGTLIEVSVDPGDPEQIIITNAGGSNRFTIGFRIDRHNSQTANPCITAPPSNRNAFPATDRDGVASLAGNWLFAVNCGQFGCPAGWTPFSQLGLCRPSGDWAIAATWSSLSCIEGFGACCKLDGTCAQLFDFECNAIGGTYQGDGSTCATVNCPTPTGACCFPNGFCLVLSQAQCGGTGGTYAGHGTVCEDVNGNGQFDICEADEPCPADRNGDGILDFFDVQNFLSAFSAQNPNADINGDSIFDFFDVQAYLGLFSAGCP